MSKRSGAIRNVIVIIVIALAILLSGRSAIGRAPPDHPLSALKMLAVGHPMPATDHVMLSAARAADAGQPLDRQAQLSLIHIAQWQPLSAVPFLIEGALAELNGDIGRAVLLYEAARRRDPRSGPARLVLAQAYARKGDTVGALMELEAATRFQPKSRVAVIPALAAMAKEPGGEAIISKLLEERPKTRALVLQSLASDASNITLLLKLQSRNGKNLHDERWKQVAIDALVADGQAVRARQLWAKWYDASNREVLTDPTFSGTPAGVFGWTVLSSGAGVATLADGGGLEVIHFGRDQATFARQLLTLQPGRYALSTSYDGLAPSDQIFWNLRCHLGEVLTQLPLSRPGLFEVPTNCDAQWLELAAIGLSNSQTVEMTVRAVRLERLAK